MKKKYQAPRIAKIKLDIKQSLITGCKINGAPPASGFSNQSCNKKCTTDFGT